ncbi:hypothetical protein LCGC14_1164780 [marine sediment metagenome]|uniref:Uncharacterized protein n=1 Tax=marine sediment metagenome TaxID=412755 RepID=A0A0F9LWN7_9ZZZZ
MSEHMSIRGLVDYWRLPYDEEGAFTIGYWCSKKCDDKNDREERRLTKQESKK